MSRWSEWRRFFIVTTVTTIFVAGCAMAAIWQNCRYYYKLQIVQKLSHLDHSPVFIKDPLFFLSSQPEEFDIVSLFGRYQADRLFLWDEQFQNGQPGYRVMVPFLQTLSGHILLVDIGWLPYSDTSSCWNRLKQQLPHDEVLLSGMLRRILPVNRWFRTYVTHDGLVFSRLDRKLLSSLWTGQQIDPWQIVLLSVEDTCLHVSQQTHPTLSPERHRGYVFQWLMFLLVALVLYVQYAYRFYHRIKKIPCQD